MFTAGLLDGEDTVGTGSVEGTKSPGWPEHFACVGSGCGERRPGNAHLRSELGPPGAAPRETESRKTGTCLAEGIRAGCLPESRRFTPYAYTVPRLSFDCNHFG